MLLIFSHSMSIKHPVAPQSMRACMHRLTAMSVNIISTSTARDMGPGLAATTYLTGNRCSQAGKRLHWLELGGWEGVCTTSVLFVMHIRGSIRVSTSRHASSYNYSVGACYSPTGPDKI
jgi:hypothetical protein